MTKVLYSLEDLPDFSEKDVPISLSIGFYDGLHLGHQKILQKVKDTGKTTFVLTFSDHPSHVLRNMPLAMITTLEERLQNILDFGIDYVIVLPFTKEFSKKSYDTFLRELHTKLPFQTLVFGEGDSLGRNREGDEKRLEEIAKELSFTKIFLKKTKVEGEIVSSGRIRRHIQNGELEEAEKLLGKPYSLPCFFEKTQVTPINPHPCLPPEERYHVLVKYLKFPLENTLIIKSPKELYLREKVQADQGVITFKKKCRMKS